MKKHHDPANESHQEGNPTLASEDAVDEEELTFDDGARQELVPGPLPADNDALADITATVAAANTLVAMSENEGKGKGKAYDRDIGQESQRHYRS